MLAKFLERAMSWGRVGCGLQLTLLAARGYLTSVMGFVAQLFPPPESWKQTERQALATLLPGPRSWISAAVLRDPSSWGFSGGLSDMDMLSMAARYRVAVHEARKEGGLRVFRRAQELRQAIASTEHVVRKVAWAAWFEDAAVFHFESAQQHFETLGFGKRSMRLKIAGPASADQDEAGREEQIRQAWQRTGVQILLTQPDPTAANFWRRRLERWAISVFPRIRVLRAFKVMDKLHDAAPPCIRAALLRTWFNGWCTGRRFQQVRSCIFGCEYEDSIEHYAKCPVVQDFGWSRLAIARSSSNLATFLLLDSDPATLSRDVAVRLAIRTAAVHRVHCQAWHALHGHLPSAATLDVVFLELVRGHSAAMVCAHAPLG